MDRPTVVVELAEDPRFAKDLAAGGVFVAGCALAINSECDLIVRGASGEVSLPARVVYVDKATGAGLELVGFSPNVIEQITAISIEPAPEHDDDDDDSEPNTVADRQPDDAGDDDDDDDAEPKTATYQADGDDADEDEEGEDGATDSDGKPLKPKTILEKLRGLSLAQQVRKANSSDPSTRIALERMYGKAVWEALLRNPRLTAPEVARLARMGTLPRIQLEAIINNGAWLQIPEVRRALLTNPRLGTDQILRVLRLMAKHELKVAASTTAYTFAVRDAAKKMVKDD